MEKSTKASLAEWLGKFKSPSEGGGLKIRWSNPREFEPHSSHRTIIEAWYGLNSGSKIKFEYFEIFLFQCKMAYIYKITNKITGKCYIGETMQKTPEARWKGHRRFNDTKRTCPVLAAAIKKHGIDNFKFEVLIICFDEDRFIYEREYIKKYNSQVPNGYNILPGGEGFHANKTNNFDLFREKHKESMKKVDISASVKNSKIFRKAVDEGRVGGKAHRGGKPSTETKSKIKSSVVNYYKETHNLHAINIEKHREAMTKAVGRKIAQYNIKDELIKEYNSIREADRLSGVKKSNIQHVLAGEYNTAGGYIWKYVN